MALKLLTELTEDVGGVILEYSGGQKKYYIEGPFIQAEIKNRNGRIYPRQMMEQVVEEYTREMIDTKRALGELGHPPTPTINHERACHIVESLKPEGNNWMGRAKVLAGGEFPMGNIVKGLIDEGVNFGVSTRGVGALKTKNNAVIVENYKLSTAADVVSDPSGPDAWARGLLEGASWVWDPVNEGWVREEVIAQLTKTLDKPSRLVTEEMKLKAFTKFVTELSNQNNRFTK